MRIIPAFSPISDVTAFSHREGMTHLQILEQLRKHYNILVANYNNLKGYILTQQEAIAEVVGEFTATATVPVDEFNAMTASLGALKIELSAYMTQNTDYAALLD